MVWKINGDQLTPTPVKLGITDGVVSEVVSGDIQPGEKIAVPAAGTTNPKGLGIADFRFVIDD